MAHDGKTQRGAIERTPGALELAASLPEGSAEGVRSPAAFAKNSLGAHKPGDASDRSGGRRPAKRRPAGPARPKIAANDDAPSIGGLIYALQQKPSNKPFQVAAIGSGAWLLVSALLAWATHASGGSVFSGPALLVSVTAVSLPIALIWFLALLAWRAQELKLMSSAMTEVAVRLAEPDRAAEQSAASLGQAVRRQVSFMNEAISRALGRAGELEAMVHNEVAALEKSYNQNEHKIKGLIQELVNERHALVSTTDTVAETLKSMGSEVPSLIEKLSQQQVKLAKIIEGAGQNLIALENQLTTASGGLESALANRTQQLQAVLDDYTVALDATLAHRAEALDRQLVERTRALDAAFSERLVLFDEAMLRSTQAIDVTVNEKARALSVAMESHVQALSDTLGRQASTLDQSMLRGLDAVRRTSESVTHQSLRAIEDLSSQAEVLKGVSENLLHQMSGVSSNFGSQGQSIVSAASALEQVNTRIDSALQMLSGKTSHLDQLLRGHSASMEGARAEAEARARQLAQQLAHGSTGHAAMSQAQAMAAEIGRLRAEADAQAKRAIEDMRAKAGGAPQEASQRAGRFGDAGEDLRAVQQAAQMLREHERLRTDAERLPIVTRESAEAMRSALNDQLRALEQLSSLASQQRREAGAPAPGAPLPLVAASYPTQPAVPAPPPPQAPPMHQAALEGGERWSLGDLLARASRDDDGTPRGPQLDIEGIARALDPTTASAIWSRFRAGQRGIMVRSIYTSEGRTSFDDVTGRYGGDAEFRRTVDRFLTDFEQLVRETEQKSPRAVHDHLVPDAGRVYLFLAHASGRLR
jgi:hypothetical protein